MFHIRAKQMGLCFEFASIIDEKLQGVVEPVDETHGFRYMDGKAIIGFVDGTENPAVDENPYHFAVVGEEDADFAGGSYVFVQKYIHDMVAWNALPVEEQEKVIGRRKFNDVELSDEEKPQNAHNAVTNIGDDLKNSSVPICRSPIRLRENMVLTSSAMQVRSLLPGRCWKVCSSGNPVGNTDRLLDFSTAVTGTLFLCSFLRFAGRIGRIKKEK